LHAPEIEEDETARGQIVLQIAEQLVGRAEKQIVFELYEQRFGPVRVQQLGLFGRPQAIRPHRREV